jgi:hypothetical protein
MRAKLNKVDNGYVLLVNNIMYATDNDKLSKENCDEMFGIVDDFDIALGKAMSYGDEWNKPETLTDAQKGYLHGFCDALEMNKDKVFTLDEIKEAIRIAQSIQIDHKTGVLTEYKEEEILKMLQPTEIEVEIVTEEEFNFDPAMGISQGHYYNKPKLDSAGNLILKKL